MRLHRALQSLWANLGHPGGEAHSVCDYRLFYQWDKDAAESVIKGRTSGQTDADLVGSINQCMRSEV